jgi:hypothetical protein
MPRAPHVSGIYAYGFPWSGAPLTLLNLMSFANMASVLLSANVIESPRDTKK